MRSKLILLLLLIHHLSATSLDTVENMKEKDEERVAITNKFSHGNFDVSHAVNGGNGGTPVVSGGNDGSHSPKVQGGGGVTPLYAAGSANNHHPHHGGGSHHRCGRRGVGILAMLMFVWFLL